MLPAHCIRLLFGPYATPRVRLSAIINNEAVRTLSPRKVAIAERRAWWAVYTRRYEMRRVAEF